MITKDSRTNAQWRILQLETESIVSTMTRSAINVHRYPFALDYIDSPSDFHEIVRCSPEELARYSHMIINYNFSAREHPIVGGLVLAALSAGLKKKDITIYIPKKSDHVNNVTLDGIHHHRGHVISLFPELATRIMDTYTVVIHKG